MKVKSSEPTTSSAAASVAADVRRLKLNSVQPQHRLKLGRHLAVGLVLMAATASLLTAGPARLVSPATGPGANSQSIPWADLGAKATAQYSGDGLAVCAAADGVVRLRCAFQRLAGEVTSEGLWLTSTVEGAAADRFRVVADYVGRDGGAMVALPESGAAACEAAIARYGGHGADHPSRHLYGGTVLPATIISLTPRSSSPLAPTPF